MPPHHITSLELVHELVEMLTYDEVVAVGLVLNELIEAKRKHPEWPADQVYAAAIVAEESGELVQAVLNAHFSGTSRGHAKTEAEHTAATAIRFIANFPVELPTGKLHKAQ